MIGVFKALYDYTPQDPENELALVEDQILYILDQDDAEWWKAKAKAEGDEDGPIGLVPSNYLEEVPPISRARAIYAYSAQNEEELTMGEDDLLQVFEKDEEWLLVRLDSGGKLGYVPGTYVQEEAGSAGDTGFAAGAAATSEQEPESPQTYLDPSERSAAAAASSQQAKKADKIVTWVVSELDQKKKKKKGTLGVGNGAVFFASESDKNPIQQFPIGNVTSASQDAKLVHLFISSLPDGRPLTFHAGSASDAAAILARLQESKAIAGAGELSTETPAGALQSPVSEEEPAPSNGKNVRWAESPQASPIVASGASAAAGREEGQAAVALYDFDAQGEDELSLREGEDLVLLQTDGAQDWLKVRNAAGQEGVVPAQYIEVGGSAPQHEDGEHQEEEDDGGAAAEAEAARRAQEAERQAAAIRAQAEKENELVAIRIANEEARRQQESIERRRRKDDERTRKEEEARRREEARRQAPAPEPPKIKHRPSAQDVERASNLSTPKGRGLPDRPQQSSGSSGRNRPTESRTRVWHDKSGQFKVEAEFLGFKAGKIRLHKLNGVVIEVPMEKMSPEDMEYLDRITGKKGGQQQRQIDDDDVPLGQSHAHKSRPTSQVSRENAGRSSPQVATRPQQPRKPQTDWFEFFLSAGCDMDDCMRYATAFERDKIDESILGDIESSTLRSLGLREGDVIRVRKAIAARNPAPEHKKQIESDEAYARRLQEDENASKRTSGSSSPAPALFTGAGGQLKNQTRRGRPERQSTAGSVDASAIAQASSQLTGKTSPPVVKSPLPIAEPPKAAPAPLISGFDDDAWTPRPSSTKPATPTFPAAAATVASPPPAAPAPAPAPVPVAAPVAQPAAAPAPSSLISANSNIARPGSNPVAPQASASFDYLAQIAQIKQNRPPSAPIQQMNTGMSNLSINSTGNSGFASQQPPQSYSNGLGFANSGANMGQLLQAQQTGAFQQPQQTGFQQPQQTGFQQQQGARGPLAPVAANQSLLAPLIPTNTGLPPGGFIPTRPAQNGSPANVMQPQQTGFMQPQQTGFIGSGFGGVGGGYLPPQPTGLNTNFQAGQVAANASALSSADQFNALASTRVQPTLQQQQQAPAKDFNPSNVFANMKNNKGVLDASAAPQGADKYNALRPQVTGFSGGGMGMGMNMNMGGGGFQQPQQTGFMQPQQTGFSVPMGGGFPGQMQPQATGFMQPQQTGFMQPQQTGFMPQQQTGFNPYGQQQQQNYRGF